MGGGVGGLLGGWCAAFGFDVAFPVAGGFVLAGGLLVLTVRPGAGPSQLKNATLD